MQYFDAKIFAVKGQVLY